MLYYLIEKNAELINSIIEQESIPLKNTTTTTTTSDGSTTCDFPGTVFNGGTDHIITTNEVSGGNGIAELMALLSVKTIKSFGDEIFIIVTNCG